MGSPRVDKRRYSRLALFSEPSYTTIGDPYTDGRSVAGPPAGVIGSVTCASENKSTFFPPRLCWGVRIPWAPPLPAASATGSPQRAPCLRREPRLAQRLPDALGSLSTSGSCRAAARCRLSPGAVSLRARQRTLRQRARRRLATSRACTSATQSGNRMRTSSRRCASRNTANSRRTKSSLERSTRLMDRGRGWRRRSTRRKSRGGHAFTTLGCSNGPRLLSGSRPTTALRKISPPCANLALARAERVRHKACVTCVQRVRCCNKHMMRVCDLLARMHHAEIFFRARCLPIS